MSNNEIAMLLIKHMKSQNNPNKISLKQLYTTHDISEDKAREALKLLEQSDKISYVLLPEISNLATTTAADPQIDVNYANYIATKIILPEHVNKSTLSIESDCIVIMGANGSGKTRFGADIERLYLNKTHRISAQKSLKLPELVGLIPTEIAEKNLLYGDSRIEDKISNRWAKKPVTHTLDDFSNLMGLLHAEESSVSIQFRENFAQKQDSEIPRTRLDRIQNIWESVLNHKKIFKTTGKIEVSSINDNNSKYNASEMSDGERVIFYLIGQAVCAPLGSILIFDEPEMHIHKSIITKVWDAIEQERPDCTFIYITHDIDFAISRQNAKKIWIKSFDNNVWDYEQLEDSDNIPELLYLEILGSRKPILFIEGTTESIDCQLYKAVFTNYTVKSLGSCEKVIQVVKSFNEQKSFHHIQSYGLIDRDQRTEKPIEQLNSSNIWVLNVAEAENLLLKEDIIRAVAVSALIDNPDEVVSKVKKNVITFFSQQIEKQAKLHFKQYFEKNYLACVTQLLDEKEELVIIQEKMSSKLESINLTEKFDEIKNKFQELIDNQDYDEVLKVFNLKNAIIAKSSVCDLCNISSKPTPVDALLKQVVNLIKQNRPEGQKIKNVIVNSIDGLKEMEK